MSIEVVGKLIDSGIGPDGVRRIVVEDDVRFVEVVSLTELEVRAIGKLGDRVRITIERIDK